MDRPGLVSGLPPPAPDELPQRPRRQGWGRILAPIFVAGAVLLKVAGSLKFLGIFVALGGYALIWGWRFAVGFILLILVHELGHYVEARRQGLKPQLPVFIPFLGAYVALRDQPFDPWRNALVSAAGPFAGGIARARVPRLRQRDRLQPPARARLQRLPAQPLQPDPDRVPRRRPYPPLVADPPRWRRPCQPGGGAAARRGSSPSTRSLSPLPSRSACSPRTSRRTGFDGHAGRPPAAAPARRGDTFRRRVHRGRVPGRVPEGRRDRPGRGLVLRLRARG